MNLISRTITGICAIVIGLVLLVVSVFTPFLLIYAIPAIIVGMFILFNKNEDKIEQIKK